MAPSTRFLCAAMRAFVPVYGPTLSRAIANFSVLNAGFPSLSWPRPHERVWILSPHPDDESLGCGGLLSRCAAANVPTKIVFLTSGDGSRATQFVLRFNPRFNGSYDLLSIAQKRQVEARNAVRELGLHEDALEFLGFPDGGMETIWKNGFLPSEPFVSPFTGQMHVPYEEARIPHAPFCRQSVLDALVTSLREFQPTLVLTTPAFDTLRDHVASFHFLTRALALANLKQAPDFWIYLIHHGIWPVPLGLHPDKRLVPPAHLLKAVKWHSLELSQDEMETKRLSLACHDTQMTSTLKYLNTFVRQNELFAPVPVPA